MRRYRSMDGLRGVAALVVMIHHSGGLFSSLPGPHGWLAVDLFFVLSGFVLAQVYEPRFSSGLKMRSFMLQRYIRLWPLFAIGALIGLVSELIAFAFGRSNFSVLGLAVAAITALLIFPAPPHAGKQDLVPLNKPGWSLIFELMVNWFYAAAWPWLRTSTVWCIVIACACAFLLLSLVGREFEGVSFTQFWGGFPRVGFSFFAGVLIARKQANAQPRHSRYAWTLLAVLLTALYAAPLIGNARLGALFDLFCVLIGFPAIVVVATRLEPVNPRLFDWLGTLSYPLYAVHEPIIYFGWRGLSAVHASATIMPYAGIVLCAGSVVVANLLARYFDPGARGWLTRRMLRPRAQRPLEESRAL